jgi:CheY-like chemotaxis protein
MSHRRRIMARRLLLVAPAERDRTALRAVLEASGYEVVEMSTHADAGSFQPKIRPDLILLDHEADTRTRAQLRSHLGADGRRAAPVVEMCLTAPGILAQAPHVLDRVI